MDVLLLLFAMSSVSVTRVASEIWVVVISTRDTAPLLTAKSEELKDATPFAEVVASVTATVSLSSDALTVAVIGAVPSNVKCQCHCLGLRLCYRL